MYSVSQGNSSTLLRDGGGKDTHIILEAMVRVRGTFPAPHLTLTPRETLCRAKLASGNLSHRERERSGSLLGFPDMDAAGQTHFSQQQPQYWNCHDWGERRSGKRQIRIPKGIIGM